MDHATVQLTAECGRVVPVYAGAIYKRLWCSRAGAGQPMRMFLNTSIDGPAGAVP